MAASTPDPLSREFPLLKPGTWKETSPRDPRYNCVAWAARDNRRWWWPGAHPRVHWPAGQGEEPTVESFERLFRSFGYEEAGTAEPEPGTEKIALFGEELEVLHVARQLPNGRWTSKLGKGIDVEHDLPSLEGGIYGSVIRILHRRGSGPGLAPRPSSATPP